MPPSPEVRAHDIEGRAGIVDIEETGLDAGKVEHEGRALSPAELARALRTGAS